MPANCLRRAYTSSPGEGKPSKVQSFICMDPKLLPQLRGWLISAAMEHNTGETRSLRQTSRNSKSSRSRGKSSSAGKRKKCSQLGCENGWDGDVQESWSRHPELQRSWFLQSLEKAGKGAKRQNLMEQGNVGSPEMNGNGCEDLRLVDCLSQGTTESSSFRRLVASPWKKGG